jgi:hypothetical protein
MTLSLFRGEMATCLVATELDTHHYLGRNGRGWAWSDERGVLVLGPPTSRSLPKDWLELSRWCLRDGQPNAGSQQWAEVRRHIIATRPMVTTVVSYSDPAAGHDGALYRACGWVWAPTWHRLRPPPTGGGSWNGRDYQAPKDRWVCCLRPDSRRPDVLSLSRPDITKSRPWMLWQEPRIKRGLSVPNSGGVDFKRWKIESC